MRTIIYTENAPKPIKNVYNQAVIVNGGSQVFTAGQLGIDPKTGQIVEGGVKEQAHQALENIKAIVEHAGSSMSQVIKVTVLLDNIDDFGAMNEIYVTFFSDSPPARTAFEVARLPLGAMVEIEAVAQIEQV